ncbi:MAG TPA: response regulator transcription factor [Acidimicrobiia bacterium]|nr:response regulator transcription factor [Acidimicrobiia bacterium]
MSSPSPVPASGSDGTSGSGERLLVVDDEAALVDLVGDAPEDLRTGFGHGGDDYVTKPFSLEELNFRIQAVLRRSRGSAAEDGETLGCADLRMDVDAHRVWRADDEVELSPTEFRLLRFLLINRGRVLSKSQILDHVWQYDFDGDGSVVETYISYLRKKLDRGGPSMIRTVRGFGYSVQEPDAAS